MAVFKTDIADQENSFYKAALTDSVFPFRLRRALRKTFGWFSILSLFTTLFIIGGFAVTTSAFFYKDKIVAAEYLSRYQGAFLRATSIGDSTVSLFFIFFSLWMVMWFLEWFYRSYLYLDEAKVESGMDVNLYAGIPDFTVSKIYFNTLHGDLLKSFLISLPGEQIMARLGLGRDMMSSYLKGRKNFIDFKEYREELNNIKDIRELAEFIFEKDKDFQNFLFKEGLTKKEVLGAAGWVSRVTRQILKDKRWWSREGLSTVSPLASDFAYGGAYILGKYSRDLTAEAAQRSFPTGILYGAGEVQKIESILSRSQEANALLVGEAGVGKLDVILYLAKRIREGKTLANLHNRRVIAFDPKILAATKKTKSDFEAEIIKVFTDVIKSGNIILVIENFPNLMQDANVLGSDIAALLDPYLASRGTQVIAMSDTEKFHSMIEPNGILMKRFETVLLEEPEENEIVIIVENEAQRLESENDIFFTYPAISAIATSAENYIVDGVMPDKAVDLLVEIVPHLLTQGKHVVLEKDVYNFVEGKTDIPVGDIGTKEKEKLEHLEELLHKRVVGQEEAIDAVASAIRRARSGVRAMNRPIGSFLFMGPTGVGKTEVSKTLAEAFFGSEDALSRLDMSEYQSFDGLARLIGSFETGKVGALSKLLREHPYGVVLLDELEKANPDVLDLLLQILDEGFFHDMYDKKINARNSIFIATSNAASDLIQKALKAGENLSQKKDFIVDEIIKQKIFKPELINRFDGVILFHPLGYEHYIKIASLMLEKLKKRLRDRNIDLIITQPLIDMVVREGSDLRFGARPMNRVIQEKVEQLIAEKMISGEIKEGQSVELSEDELK